MGMNSPTRSILRVQARDAQTAINGLELAGKRIIVSLVADAPPPPTMPAMLGIGIPGLGMLGGFGAMAGMPSIPTIPVLPPGNPNAPPSQFVLMKNMFDPNGKEEQEDKVHSQLGYWKRVA